MTAIGHFAKGEQEMIRDSEIDMVESVRDGGPLPHISSRTESKIEKSPIDIFF